MEERDRAARVAVSSSDHKHPPSHDCEEDGEGEEKADREGGRRSPEDRKQ